MLFVLKSPKSFSESSALHCIGQIDHACEHVMHALAITNPMTSVSHYEIELIGTVVQNY